MKLSINNLNHEGEGVGNLNGKVVFVAETLPDEQVKIKIAQQRKRFDIGQLLAVEQASPFRVPPPCADAEDCGGCSWQHIDSAQQIYFKQQIWLNQLQRLGRLQPQRILPPVEASHWRYRSRARLAWDGQHLGFRRRRSHAVVHPRDCLILPAEIAAQLADLQALLRQESASILAVDVSRGADVILWRIISKKRLAAEKYRDFAAKCSEISALPQAVLLQDEQGTRRLPEDAPPLGYRWRDLEFRYFPDDFTQIHPEINAKMIDLALEALEVQAGEKILDAFGGLGNFALPLAQAGADVLLLEGDAAMVKRARTEALRQGLRLQSRRQDLFKISPTEVAQLAPYRKWLLDPPRAGAQQLLQSISKALPQRLLYVSCDAGTLARDAAILAAQGYLYESGRVLNMFPQTAHVESLNLFRLASA